MLKAVTPDKKLIILGLSDENISRLTKGDPILVKGEELGLGDLQIMIFHGKTEQDMRKQFIDGGIKLNNEKLDMKVFRGPQKETTQ